VERNCKAGQNPSRVVAPTEEEEKENYLKEKCQVLEEHNKKGRTRDLH
jgi:hypothetical protein